MLVCRSPGEHVVDQPRSTVVDIVDRSCASPVLTAIGLVNGNPAYLTPPPESTSLNRSLKIGTGDYVHDFYSCAKFG